MIKPTSAGRVAKVLPHATFLKKNQTRFLFFKKTSATHFPWKNAGNPRRELEGNWKATGRELGKGKRTGKTQHFIHAEEKELEKHSIFNHARERELEKGTGNQSIFNYARERELEKHSIFNHAQERELEKPRNCNHA